MADTSVGDNNQNASMQAFNMPFLEQPNVAQKPIVQQSAGTSTTAGALNQSSLEKAEDAGLPPAGASADIDPTAPTPPPPDVALADMPKEEVQKGRINQFLCCIFAVALVILADLLSRILNQKQNVEIDKGLDALKIQGDVAEQISKNQEKQGTLALAGAVAKAICCGVQVGISAGVGVGSAWKGPRTATGAAITQTGQALSGIGGQDSIASNLADGIVKYMDQNIQAQNTILTFQQQFAQQIASDMSQDRKDTMDQLNSLLQQFTQWMTNYYQMQARG